MKALLNIFRRRFSHARTLAPLLFSSAGACFFIFLYFLIAKHPKNAAVALLFLWIILLLPLFEHWLKIRICTPCYGGLLFLCLGSLLGSTFNFYFRIPFWDTVLHALSGFLFAYIGYEICARLFSDGKRHRPLPYLLMGVSLSLSIALLWELFEACATLLLPVDMQEDTLVHAIRSFYLSGTHDVPTEICGITETVIRYADGKVLALPGYLDLGLLDTLADMAICLGGNLLFLALYPFGRFLGGRRQNPSVPSDEK